MISFFEFDSKRLRVDAYALNHAWSIHIAQIKWAEEPFSRMGGMGEFVGFWLCHDKIHLNPSQGSVIFLWPYDPSPSREVVVCSLSFTQVLAITDPPPLPLKTTWSHQNPPPRSAPTRPASHPYQMNATDKSRKAASWWHDGDNVDGDKEKEE